MEKFYRLRRFQKVDIFGRNFENFEKSGKFSKMIEGCAPALRVIRAGTRLTVHRSLPYWCKSNPRPESTEFIYNIGLFGDVFDEETVDKSSRECNNKFKLYIEALDRANKKER